ncbi:bis-aminopropyl spermidine synthase family protein [Amycolatopsis cihanbeyliensis]|uniref:bis-aminopropyl spermidine synthase family protein n=1 Tax=Amycolatopsis cihanbeyliensis TaxID=1128664 RepID=UPI001476E419|nr:bis-aminopropyl spermidine synthase family protein [Amycolatopsis cihanbeyliensis]
MTTNPAELRSGIERYWGIDLPLALGVLEQLADGGSHRMAELVARSGVSREGVKQVLGLLGSAVSAEDRAVRLDPDFLAAPDQLRPVLTRPDRGTEERLRTVLAAARADLPAPRRDLDHVPATVDTVVHRALWLTERFHLAGHRLLVLGDRDLTGLAVAALLPSVQVTVVDVDDTVLGVLGEHARRAALDVRTWFADLRLGLPEPVRDGADLVFTDPPYTADGIGLFARRGLEGLRRSGWARMAICYGSGERQVELSFQVQRALTRLGLMLEAVLPRFNTYQGAEALGSASSLYLCRPTKHAWKQPGAEDGRLRIYSHGASSLESADRLPAGLIGGQQGTGEELTVGEGWGRHPAVPVPDYLATLTGEAPGVRKRAMSSAVWLDLTAGFAGQLPRVLLCGPGRELTVAAPAGAQDTLAGHPHLDRLIRAGYRLEVRQFDGRVAVVTRRAEGGGSPVAAAAAELAKRTGAVAANALREALITGCRAAGRQLSKNEARALLAEAGLPAAMQLARPAELPLTELDAAARALLGILGYPDH